MPERGEVWQVDFGITQKVRPALVISIPCADTDRARIGVVPHTTATRGSQFEVSVRTSFLTEGAFLVQGIQALQRRRPALPFPRAGMIGRWLRRQRPVPAPVGDPRRWARESVLFRPRGHAIFGP